MTTNCERIYKEHVRVCTFLFLLYAGYNQNVWYLRKKKEKLKCSNSFQGKRQFLTKLLLIYVKVNIVHRHRRLLLCVLIVSSGTAEYAQAL